MATDYREIQNETEEYETWTSNDGLIRVRYHWIIVDGIRSSRRNELNGATVISQPMFRFKDGDVFGVEGEREEEWEERVLVAEAIATPGEGIVLTVSSPRRVWRAPFWRNR